MFDSTCGSTSTPLTSITNHAGSEVACTGTMRCPGGSSSATFTAGSECKWTRKLCVTCSTTSAGVVQIRVQTNILPNNFSQGGVSNPTASNTDWTVNFNPDVSGVIQYASSSKNLYKHKNKQICLIFNKISAEYISSAIDSSAKVTKLFCDI